MAGKKTEWTDIIVKTEAFLDDLLVSKAPALPKNAKDWVVVVFPWLALIFGLVGVFGSLRGLGFSTFFTPFVPIVGRTITMVALFYSLITLLQSGLELLAVPSLFKKVKKGWKLLFYSSLVGIVSSVLQISVFGLVLQAVSLYFLFQVKERYR